MLQGQHRNPLRISSVLPVLLFPSLHTLSSFPQLAPLWDHPHAKPCKAHGRQTPWPEHPDVSREQ